MMGATTGISWTDSTFNSWWGCTKVSPACDHCYAEAVDRRTGETHWGAGAERRLLSAHARNEPYRWQKNAEKFKAEHGRRRRAFTLSMGDLFDNEVPVAWREEHMRTLAECDQIDWQICTKRVGNIERMVPSAWLERWPRHIGVLITAINQAEVSRDVPKLRALKGHYSLPWIGVSHEPALGRADFCEHLGIWWNAITGVWERSAERDVLDWIIVGGESGHGWRPMDLEWARSIRDQCETAGTSFFFKQVSAFRPTDAMIPEDLRIRQFPQ